MNKQLFKEGDKVYYPPMSNKIFTLESHKCDLYPLRISNHDEHFTLDGKYFYQYAAPSIFHATQKNREILSKLYGTKFEKRNEFKVGDEVYCPILGTDIYPIRVNNFSYCPDYPYLILNQHSEFVILDHDGFLHISHQASYIFHATDENCQLLSKLYGIRFEKPAPSKEIEE